MGHFSNCLAIMHFLSISVNAWGLICIFIKIGLLRDNISLSFFLVVLFGIRIKLWGQKNREIITLSWDIHHMSNISMNTHVKCTKTLVIVIFYYIGMISFIFGVGMETPCA